MNFNPLTKSLFKHLFTKISGLKMKLPKDEKGRVELLTTLCDEQKEQGDYDVETFVKMNCVILITIWFSNADYDNIYQIKALENIVAEYEKDPDICEFLAIGCNIETCYQMLIRNCVENPDYALTVIEQRLDDYRELLGDKEQLAYEDERFNYEFMSGQAKNIAEQIDKILSLPKGDASDCYACIVNRMIRVCICYGEYTEASKLITKVFDEKLSCDHIPKRTYVQKLLVDYQLEGSPDSLIQSEKTALKKLDTNESELFEASMLLGYAHLAGRTELGEKVIEKFREIGLSSDIPDAVFFCREAFLFTGDEAYAVRAREQALRFDMRNGNTFYSDYIEGKGDLSTF